MKQHEKYNFSSVITSCSIALRPHSLIYKSRVSYWMVTNAPLEEPALQLKLHNSSMSILRSSEDRQHYQFETGALSNVM